MIMTDVTESVGRTPLVELERMGRQLLAARDEYTGKLIVVLLADTGERYITTELFA